MPSPPRRSPPNRNQKRTDDVMMDSEENSTLYQVQNYRKLVLIYEALQKQINALIMAGGGNSEQMSEEDRTRYRELANRRDEVLNEIRVLEQRLLDEE